MKTFEFPPSLPIGKWVVALAVVTIVGAFGIRNSFADGIAMADLTLTETSSTTLSLTYTGPDAQPGLFTVMNTGKDTWTITVAQNLGPVSFNNFANDWAEPEDPTQMSINEVFHSTTNNPTQIFVRSDFPLAQDSNGTVSPDNTAIVVGQDSGVPISLTFHDVAATSETAVPDTGSTFVLLGLVAIALYAVHRGRLFASA